MHTPRSEEALKVLSNGAVDLMITDLSMLGKRTMLDLIASKAARQTFQLLKDQGFALEEFWLHNMAVGFAAQTLSSPLDPEIGQSPTPSHAKPEPPCRKR